MIFNYILETKMQKFNNTKTVLIDICYGATVYYAAELRMSRISCLY